MIEFPKCLFVTGTDTGVGKTLVSAMLVTGLKGGYWKPVQSGADCGTDTDWVREKTALPKHHFLPETYCLKGYMSPHTAAAHENVEIELDAFHPPVVDPLHHPAHYLVIEGAGGLMVPLSDKWLMLDLIKKLAAPVLLVARSGLGTINHTLLSLEKLRGSGIDVFAVVMNGPKDEENRKAIEHFGKTDVLAQIEPMDDINAGTLELAYRKYFG
jgi:dethiobiotin synthetase